MGIAQQNCLTALFPSSGKLRLERELEQDAPSVLDLVLELVSLVCGDCQPAQGQASRRIGDCRRKRPSCETLPQIEGNPCLSTKPSEAV